MNDSQKNATALLFEDKLGLGRYGGMAVAVTAVSQVAEQFTGFGLYVALTFSFLIAVYYARRAVRLPFFDCLIWVPIYGCTLFITSLGSNNVVGTTQEKSQFQSARAAYENTFSGYQNEIRAMTERLNAYETALEKSQQAQEIYRKLLEAKAPGMNLSSSLMLPSLKSKAPRSILGGLFDLFRPNEAHAQPTVSPSTGTAAASTQIDSDKIRQLLLQLKVLKTEEKEALTIINQTPIRPRPTVRPEDIQVPSEIEPKIWKKW
jgi:hypothetical protein